LAQFRAGMAYALREFSRRTNRILCAVFPRRSGRCRLVVDSTGGGWAMVISGYVAGRMLSFCNSIRDHKPASPSIAL